MASEHTSAVPTQAEGAPVYLFDDVEWIGEDANGVDDDMSEIPT